MRTTLLQAWNYYDSIIKDRERAYIKDTVKDIPEYVYQVSGINGKIRELKIIGVRYYNRQYFSFNKRPTKLDVNIIKSFAEKPYVFSIENVYYDYLDEIVKARGAFCLKDFEKYLTKEQAEQKSEEITNKFKSEESLISNGTHTRCERCRKVVENPAIVHYKIISIATYGNAGRDGRFCSNTCAAHEQWAHEG